MPKVAPARPFVLVLAGVNGAGKSSVGGALLAEHGLTWFNPDEYARELVARLGLPLPDANAQAWEFGRVRLEAAIARGMNYAFETTLGARTIPDMLGEAAKTHDVRVWFCGLATVEQHIARVAMRAAHGGHPIPEEKIRERWVNSRENLIRLLPRLKSLQVFDNSAEAAAGKVIPDPVLVLEFSGGRITTPYLRSPKALAAIPAWARPIVEAAIETWST